ncbi:MAG: HEAT repeat domain-containing protein [Chthonomonadales bacterium]
MNAFRTRWMKQLKIVMLAHPIAFALAGAALCPPAPVAAQQPGFMNRLRTYHFGADAQLPDEVDAWVHSSLKQPDARRAVARRLARLLGPDVPFDARQLVCRELVLVATPLEVPALLPLLHDRQLAPYALMVLERIPGPQVDRALIGEMAGLDGDELIGVIDAFAARRSRLAMPHIGKLLASRDAQIAEAAATALAWIGGEDAARLLREAVLYGEATTQRIAGHALLTLAERERASGHLRQALVCYAALRHASGDPSLSAASLRGTALALGAGGVPLLLHALQAGPKRMKEIAAATLRDMPGPAATHSLCAALNKLRPEPRKLVIEALADRRDPSAQAAVARQVSSRDAGIRTAALRALGALGNASVVPVLLHYAATGSPADREAAARSLTELQDARVDGKLIAAAETSGGEVCLAAIRALAERGARIAVPFLLRAAAGPDNRIGLAAARALRDLAGSDQLGALVKLMVRTSPARAQMLADTVADIARRCPDRNVPITLLEHNLRTTRDPRKRSLLLEALAQLGGARPLAVLRSSLRDPDADVRATALRLLAEWQSSEPAPDLLSIARTAPDTTTRAVALRGFVRMVALDTSLSPAAALARYRDALSLARSADERRQVLSGIARVRSRDALALAASFLNDAEVRAEAEAAVVQIAACTAGTWPEDTRALLEPIAGSSANEDIRKRAAQLLESMDHFGGFDMAWEVSPPYSRQGVDYAHLFDMPFPPEDPNLARQVPWQLMPVGLNPEQPWLVDLLGLWGGEQRVAYLRTQVWCNASRDLVLSVGSDDGVKAWWNGEVVLAQNVARAVAPDQDRVTVHARAGWNSLMLKITQNIMGWGACARFFDPDGTPATALRFSIPSATTETR